MENTTNNQEVIPVSGFNGIHFKSVGKVMLSQGDTEGLTIQADPEVRALIRTEVKDGILLDHAGNRLEGLDRIPIDR